MSQKKTIRGQMLPIICGEAPKLFDEASPNHESIRAVSALTPLDEIVSPKLSGSRVFGVPDFRGVGLSASRAFGLPGFRGPGCGPIGKGDG